MEPYEESRRQIRIAIVAMLVIMPSGVIGYMLIEGMPLLDAVWMTVITLTTIGYGDIVPQTPVGRIFTLFLIVIGIGAFVFAGQAVLTILFSPDLARARLRRRTDRKIARLRGHFVICGEGEMVDRTVMFILQRVRARLEGVRGPLLRWRTSATLLDVVVVVTKNGRFANRLRRSGMTVIEGDPTDDESLRRAGIEHAQALMALEDTDTETLLTVLTANSRNPDLLISAAAHDPIFAPKMLRAGASNVIPPFDVAAQFLNGMTFRPVVSEFFTSIVFDNTSEGVHTVQIFLYDDSPWIGKTLGELDMRGRYDAAAIGLRREDGTFLYVPDDAYVLSEDDVLLVVCPAANISEIMRASRRGTQYRARPLRWQRLINVEAETAGRSSYTQAESEHAVERLELHYIICGDSLVASSAIGKLSPDRPFVIVSSDQHETERLLERGFRVIQGRPTDEATLIRAGIQRALAIMVSLDDRADSVIVTLTARTLNRQLLITASADTDDHVLKLYRAGADRVISPYRIAAQFMLLATTRPVVSDFITYVLYNRLTHLETSELYIDDTSPWVGRQIGDLDLQTKYEGRVIGARLTDDTFVYAPPPQFRVEAGHVMLIVTTMERFDSLREDAYGSANRRPKSFRTAKPASATYRAGERYSLS